MKNKSGQNIKKSFGKKIQYYRNLKGLTQSELAIVIGRTEETVSNIERGTNWAKLEIISKIAETLDVDIMELFNFADDKKIKDREKFSLIRDVINILENKDKKYIRGLISLIKNQ